MYHHEQGVKEAHYVTHVAFARVVPEVDVEKEEKDERSGERREKQEAKKGNDGGEKRDFDVQSSVRLDKVLGTLGTHY